MGFYCFYIWIMENSLFKTLTPSEEVEFRKWARENYVPGGLLKSTWHPVVKDECRKINDEQTPYQKWAIGIESNQGSFQIAIFNALVLASEGNRKKLTIAFPEWF